MDMGALDNMNLLSTPRESDLDRVTRTAQKVFGTEIALVSLVDAERLDRTIERIEVILGELRALRSDMLGDRPAEKD